MNVLILGAHGQIARVAIDLFLQRTDARLTLYLREARRLRLPGAKERVRVIEGDVLDLARWLDRMSYMPTWRVPWSSKRVPSCSP
jgi:saccharopine dehydrogenase-like NADP-dependent oxidoreductase